MTTLSKPQREIMPVTQEPKSTSSFVVGVSLIFLLTSGQVSGSVISFNYNEIMDSTVGLPFSTRMVNGTTHTQCAKECFLAADCTSFFWCFSNTSCVLGPKAVFGGSVLPVGCSRLYTQLDVVQPQCRLDLGFEIRTYDEMDTCVFISTHKLSYLDAWGYCLLRGARLIKVNSKYHLKLLLKMMEENGGMTDLYVGLSDMGQEDQLIWSDGQVLTLKERSDFFNRYQTNSEENDCVTVGDDSKGTLKHFPCDTPAYFGCEMLIWPKVEED